MKERVTVDCPHCGQEQEVLYWSSLNVQVSPEEKSDFLSGKINIFECKACQLPTMLDTPFLYHDMALKFCVQYYPITSLYDENIYTILNPDGSSVTDVDGKLSETQYLLHPHIVFSMQEALNYVVFRDNLAEYHLPDGKPNADPR